MIDDTQPTALLRHEFSCCLQDTGTLSHFAYHPRYQEGRPENVSEMMALIRGLKERLPRIAKALDDTYEQLEVEYERHRTNQ